MADHDSGFIQADHLRFDPQQLLNVPGPVAGKERQGLFLILRKHGHIGLRITSYNVCYTKLLRYTGLLVRLFFNRGSLDYQLAAVEWESFHEQEAVIPRDAS